ncbi:protein THALLO isoform X1 [Amaranthus tricolor]|uniref:protein THALLO isoform X1 n=1 Tax=Amaranthus tricolor TaxID=29722 RepID=UPI0025910689|nr:protein THALLO isoform X1 [Amaranthus tricolor]
MGKRGKSQKKGPQHSKKIKLHNEDVDFNNMDDEIDAFHKKRDIIPLDVNADNVDSDDEDDEQPIFDYEGVDGDEEEEDDDDDGDDSNLKGLVAKIARQQKFLREKLGGLDDDEHEEDEEDEKKQKVWSRGKSAYYGSDDDFELQSSGEDTPAEEEEEVIKLQKERAETLRDEDFGLQNDEEEDSDEEPTLGEIMVKGKPKLKSSSDKEAENDAAPMYEEVEKDLSALSRDELMDVVYSSAPELVGLLAELNDATMQLETQVNPLLSKVGKRVNDKKERLHYLEVKQILLIAYCQAITFYLLLKSEGLQVRDHPVVARLVEIKTLLGKMKELDGYIPDGFEGALIEKANAAPAKKLAAKTSDKSSDHFAKLGELTGFVVDKEPSKKVDEPVQKQSVEVNEKKQRFNKGQDQPVSSESMKMLQYRAALEEKLKQKAGSVAPKSDNTQKHKSKKLAGKLETTDDFDDDAMYLEDTTRDNRRTSSLSSKLSQIVPAKKKMLKGISGDDDLPERDDLGERRWKHELRVLARAGIKSKDDDDAQLESELASSGGDESGGDESGGEESEDYYNLIKQQREAKLKMKAQKYSRNPQVQFELESTVDCKRHITTQMEKNRGLTRDRKKEIKNPRKKYRGKYKKAVTHRKGQVREYKQPKFSYDGETTGINPNISRSIRF